MAGTGGSVDLLGAGRDRKGLALGMVLAVLTGVLVGPVGPASAALSGSIVFVKDYNVWIMPADDPGAARRVTTDGASGASYTLVRQDDAGRIMAVFGEDGKKDVFVRMDQSGNRLGQSFRPPATYAWIANFDLNPAGEVIAFTAQGPCDGSLVGEGWWDFCYGVDFAYADGSDSSSIRAFLPAATGPSWFSPTQVIANYTNEEQTGYGPAISTYKLSDADGETWFDTCPGWVDPDDDFSEFICDAVRDPAITRANDRLVYAVDSESELPTRLRVFTLPGAPPAQPVPECRHDGPAPAELPEPTTGEFSQLSWSPDGDGLVWERGSFDDTVPAGAGIYQASGFNTATCDGAFASTQLIVPNGHSPDWGPAEVGQLLPDPGPGDEPGDEPGDGPADTACPAGQVPPGGFTDTVGNPHGPNIDCIVWWQITRGIAEGQYGPARDVRRDQMASFLARMILNAGGTLPAATDQGFTDIAGNLHADSINRLAAAGVALGRSATTFSPGASVRRDQMASFLVRAYEHLTEEPLTATRDHFTDTAGNSHRDNINKTAEVGIAAGTSATTFAPARPVRRDQMASFIARTLGVAVQRGHAAPPQ